MMLPAAYGQLSQPRRPVRPLIGAPAQPGMTPPGMPQPPVLPNGMPQPGMPPTRLGVAQRQTDVAARQLSRLPDLATAGANQLAGLRQQTAEDRKIGIQDIGRGAAAFGRLGSGVTTGQLGDLEALLQKRQTAAETGLAGDLARQQGDESRANVGVYSGLEDQRAGYEQRGLDNRVRQRLLEEDLQNSAYSRGLKGATLGLAGSDRYAQDADNSDYLTQQLLQSYGRRKKPATVG